MANKLYEREIQYWSGTNAPGVEGIGGPIGSIYSNLSDGSLWTQTTEDDPTTWVQLGGLKQKNVIAQLSTGGGNGLGQATGATTEAYGFNDRAISSSGGGWMYPPSKTFSSAGGTFTCSVSELINSGIPMADAISSNDRLNLKGSISALIPGTNATQDFYIAYAIIPTCIGATTTAQTVSWDGVHTITTDDASGGEEVRYYVGCFDFDINGPVGATQSLLLGYASANLVSSWSPRWVLSEQD